MKLICQIREGTLGVGISLAGGRHHHPATAAVFLSCGALPFLAVLGVGTGADHRHRMLSCYRGRWSVEAR